MDDKTEKLIKSVVFKYLNSSDVRVFVFGSRATGTNVKFSDIDLGLESKKTIPYGTILDIEEDFENSDLPYMIDVVDFSKVTGKFKQVAGENKLYLN